MISLYIILKEKSTFILTSLKQNDIIMVISLTTQWRRTMESIMTVRAPGELQEFLAHEAQKHGLTRNALILQILWDWERKQRPSDDEKDRR